MSDYTSLVHSLREAVDMKDIDSIMDHFHPEMVYISSFDVKKNREELREEYLLAFDRHPALDTILDELSPAEIP